MIKISSAFSKTELEFEEVIEAPESRECLGRHVGF